MPGSVAIAIGTEKTPSVTLRPMLGVARTPNTWQTNSEIGNSSAFLHRELRVAVCWVSFLHASDEQLIAEVKKRRLL